MPQRKTEKLYQETGILGRRKTKIYPVQNFFFRPWHLQAEVCNLISTTPLMSELRFVLHDSNSNNNWSLFLDFGWAYRDGLLKIH